MENCSREKMLGKEETEIEKLKTAPSPQCRSTISCQMMGGADSDHSAKKDP